MAKRKLQTELDGAGDGVANVGLVLPMGNPDERTYVAQQSGRIDIDLGHGGKATEALRSLHAGLIQQRAVMASGRPVATKQDVVRWLFEQIAAADPVDPAA